MQSRVVIRCVFLIFVLMTCLLAVNRGFCLTSQDVPGADLPTTSASPGMAVTPAPSPAASPAAQTSPTGNDISQGPSPATEDNSTDENEIGNDAGSTDLGTGPAAESSES